MNDITKKIYLASPRGFCAGVERAVDIVEKALQIYGAPVYVRHEIVHNKWVVDDLKSKGVIFVDEISEVPDGAITIFSAHGISEKVEGEAVLRGLPIIDATCPLVTKVHKEAQRYEDEGYEIIMIGHPGHPEVEGTTGRVKNPMQVVANIEGVAALTAKDPEKVAYVTQTTLSVDDTKAIIAALQERFPQIKGPALRDICYATQNRQNAVRELAAHVDVLLVVGAKNSSNSNRLRDLGEEMGVKSYLIDDAHALNPAWFDEVETIGITAGASAPEVLVQGVIDGIAALCPIQLVSTGTVNENVHFKLPPEVLSKKFG